MWVGSACVERGGGGGGREDGRESQALHPLWPSHYLSKNKQREGERKGRKEGRAKTVMKADLVFNFIGGRLLRALRHPTDGMDALNHLDIPCI